MASTASLSQSILQEWLVLSQTMTVRSRPESLAQTLRHLVPPVMGLRRSSGSSARRATFALSETRPVPRRGLSRDEAAVYLGISASKFDQLVSDGRMPNAITLDRRKLWDIRELDAAFDALRDGRELA